MALKICPKKQVELISSFYTISPNTFFQIYKEIIEGSYDVSKWKETDLHPKKADEKAVNWIFLVDSLNFSFWQEPPSHIFYEGQKWRGYFGLCAAINRALDEGIPITDPKFYKDITLDHFRHIFRTEEESEYPMIQERLKILQAHGKTLCEVSCKSNIRASKTEFLILEIRRVIRKLYREVESKRNLVALNYC